jgi:hypothetical protein
MEFVEAWLAAALTELRDAARRCEHAKTASGSPAASAEASGPVVRQVSGRLGRTLQRCDRLVLPYEG